MSSLVRYSHERGIWPWSLYLYHTPQGGTLTSAPHAPAKPEKWSREVTQGALFIATRGH